MRSWGDVRRIAFGSATAAGREALVSSTLEPLFARGFDVDAAPHVA
jgi:hypothetical protein